MVGLPDGGDDLTSRIADLLVQNPKIAVDLANYVQTDPSITRAQRKAAEKGIALAMDRLGIKGQEVPGDNWWGDDSWIWIAALLAAAGLGAAIFFLTQHHKHCDHQVSCN